MTGAEAIDYIHSYGWKGSIPGLSRTRALLAAMGNPERKLKFIHLVGTNGKGSTAAMLASCLRAAGYRTGLYTSPYLFRFEERMQVDGVPISPESLGEIIDWVRPLAEGLREHPTEFELVTAAAMEYFCREGAQIVVLEAGMGGELDSTNVIPAPEAAVVCNIGLDHMEYLGDTVEAIAATKLRVVKPGSLCVFYGGSPSVTRVAENHCRRVGAPLITAGTPVLHSASLEGQEFSYGGRTLCIPLLGRHQLRNAAVALEALDALKARGWQISEEAIRRGMAQVSWPGRFQVVRRAPLFIVDGGHNPQCMEALAQNLRDYLPGADLTVLTGVLADKDHETMYSALLPFAARFVTVTPPNPRAMEGTALAAYLESRGAEAEAADSLESGVARSIELARLHSGAVLACGSLYMAGEIIRLATSSALGQAHG